MRTWIYCALIASTLASDPRGAVAAEAAEGSADTKAATEPEERPEERRGLRRMLSMPATVAGTFLAGPSRFFETRTMQAVCCEREIGGLSLCPVLRVTGRYSDNPYHESRHETEDWFLTLSPGLKLTAPFGDGNSIEAKYHADILKPRHQVGREATEDHILELTTHLGLADDLIMKVENDLGRLTFDEARDPKPAWFYYSDNKATVEWAVNDKWALEAAGGYQLARFTRHEIQIDDYDSPYGQATAFYQLTPNVSALSEYAYKFIRKRNDLPGQDRDNDNHALSIGLVFGEQLPVHGRFQVGWGAKSFQDSSIEDIQTYVFKGELNWDVTKKLTVSLGGRRSIEDTFRAAQVINRGRSLITESVELGAAYALSQDWTLFSGLSHGRDRFTGVGDFDGHRKDTTVGATIGVAYEHTKGICTKLTLGHFERHSKAAGEDWQRNDVTLSTSIGF